MRPNYAIQYKVLAMFNMDIFCCLYLFLVELLNIVVTLRIGNSFVMLISVVTSVAVLTLYRR